MAGKRTAEQIAGGIARVCEHIGPIRETLERGPDGGPLDLDRLLTALRAGADPAVQLEAVHRALRRAQDAVGVFGHTRDGSMLALAGIADGGGEPVLLCPRDTAPCARFAWPSRDMVQYCHVSGGPLRRTTLLP
ncbi:hypothetical protein [Glycomyces paridis]|uniref:Uncharacterized protein n=1 Tax=Glycomyces paridis TaxID=2126555 RepID=A0A4S8PDV1_9ACTN|nr:hypothetical protein [Glycomyces paridis]THV26459.1 hypothetical protein E9998_18030 [Glycomyces paridis]